MSEGISPAVLRAARAMVGWTRDQLSTASGVNTRTIARLEDGETDARASTAKAIRTALEAAGVVFVEPNGLGPGVRLRERGE